MTSAACRSATVLGGAAAGPEEVDELDGADGATLRAARADAQHARAELLAPALLDGVRPSLHAREHVHELREVVAGEREQRVEGAAVDAEALDHLAHDPTAPARA
jgi:hypothetical protein